MSRWRLSPTRTQSARELARNNFRFLGPCSVEALLAEPDIEIVVNLTIPKAHAE